MIPRIRDSILNILDSQFRGTSLRGLVRSAEVRGYKCPFPLFHLRQDINPLLVGTIPSVQKHQQWH